MELLNKYFDNARLAVDLALYLGAKGTVPGSISNFCQTPPDWICPGCARDKKRIARLNKNGDLYCSIHKHHDHLFNELASRLSVGDIYSNKRALTALRMLTRFDDEYICMDCNLAEGRMKRTVKAEENFSFSPREIYRCVCPGNNESHVYHPDKAQQIYELAYPTYKLIFDNAESLLARDFHDVY